METPFRIKYQLWSASLLVLCYNVKVGIFFWRKAEIFQKFILRSHCSFTLTDNIFITSINSVSNLVVTGKNPLRKHQMKNVCFSVFIFNQSKIQFETLEQYRMVKNIWPGIYSCWQEKSPGYILIWKIK